MYRRPPISPLFPSTTLFRSVRSRRETHDRRPVRELEREVQAERQVAGAVRRRIGPAEVLAQPAGVVAAVEVEEELLVRDRKSTRLNSSHANISYAVFCLKKK